MTGQRQTAKHTNDDDGGGDDGALPADRGELGALIKDLRTRAGLSQMKLGRLAGVSAGYIGLIEMGQRGEGIGRDKVTRIAQALGLSDADFEHLLRVSGHLGAYESLFQHRPGEMTTQQVLANDKRLTKSQRESFIRMYESIVGSAD